MIKFNILRCEHLAALDVGVVGSNSIDPYVKISFAGSKAVTKVVMKDRNPEFN